jgi:uncharacterized membrane protein YbhN (UPF0104 family)
MQDQPSRIRRTLIALAKVGLALALLAYLLNQARAHDMFTKLVEQPKRWPLLLAGLVCTLSATSLTFVRWHLLIQSVGIRTRLLDTMRLGALGYALNFVSLGSIGGDFFKAIFLAHGHKGRRTEAIATVLADRVLGLMTFLILASVGILSADLYGRATPALEALYDAILITTAIALTGAAFTLLFPPLSGRRMIAWAHGWPIIGPTASRLLAAVATYRNQKRVLAAAATISVAANVCNISAVYLVASGLPIDRPTYREHFVIVPVANMVGAIPVTPSGLGTREAAVDLLYRTVPRNQQIARGVGTMVALAHRVTEMTVAVLGLIYYLSHRRKVREVYHEAEKVADAG